LVERQESQWLVRRVIKQRILPARPRCVQGIFRTSLCTFGTRVKHTRFNSCSVHFIPQGKFVQCLHFTTLRQPNALQSRLEEPVAETGSVISHRGPTGGLIHQTWALGGGPGVRVKTG
jgi:hypothetical protein